MRVSMIPFAVSLLFSSFAGNADAGTGKGRPPARGKKPAKVAPEVPFATRHEQHPTIPAALETVFRQGRFKVNQSRGQGLEVRVVPTDAVKRVIKGPRGRTYEVELAPVRGGGVRVVREVRTWETADHSFLMINDGDGVIRTHASSMTMVESDGGWSPESGATALRHPDGRIEVVSSDGPEGAKLSKQVLALARRNRDVVPPALKAARVAGERDAADETGPVLLWRGDGVR